MNDPEARVGESVTTGLDLFDGMTPKRCPRCTITKPFADFPLRRRKTWSANSYCFTCQREYSRQHYRTNKSAHNSRRSRNTKDYAARNRAALRDYLRSRSCVDCGESDIDVLEFDHMRGVKWHDVSVMIARGLGWQSIMHEIAKCEIRCANCHRRRTARQFRWKGRGRDDDESLAVGR